MDTLFKIIDTMWNYDHYKREELDELLNSEVKLNAFQLEFLANEILKFGGYYDEYWRDDYDV